MNYSLKKDEILSNKQDISQLFINGQSIDGEFSKVIYYKYSYRAILFTSRKKFGNAVKRNKAKKYFKEFYRQNKELFKLNYLYALILMKLPQENSLEKITEDLKKTLEKI
ncbi:MAG: ribonuclease P protein component [Candidatus Marinimicrobia bacterium]|nr:ribonuclease P protein component [Candidatus Neomarinimicrobiota bacterium]